MGIWRSGARITEGAALPCSRPHKRDPCSSSHHNTYPTWNCHLLRSIHSVHTTNQLGYIHVSVNHSKNFVDPDSGAHTNTIEGVWALVKKKLKWMSGTLYEYIPSYLDEFTWFRNFGKDQAFEQLLKDIAEQFPLQ